MPLSDFEKGRRLSKQLNKYLDDFYEEIQEAVNTNITNISTLVSNDGTLSSLKTTAKTNLVGAINEVHDEVDANDAKHDAYLKKITFTAPDAVSADGVLSATALANGETTEVTEGITDPDMPRCLSIVGNAVGISGNVVINGTDEDDADLTETIVASGTDTVNGTKAFKTITDITLPARNAEADTIAVGWNDKLGLGRVVTEGYPVYAIADGSKETTDPAITKNATMALNVVDFDTASDGSKDFILFYIG